MLDVSINRARMTSQKSQEFTLYVHLQFAVSHDIKKKTSSSQNVYQYRRRNNGKRRHITIKSQGIYIIRYCSKREFFPRHVKKYEMQMLEPREANGAKKLISTKCVQSARTREIPRIKDRLMKRVHIYFLRV